MTPRSFKGEPPADASHKGHPPPGTPTGNAWPDEMESSPEPFPPVRVLRPAGGSHISAQSRASQQSPQSVAPSWIKEYTSHSANAVTDFVSRNQIAMPPQSRLLAPPRSLPKHAGGRPHAQHVTLYNVRSELGCPLGGARGLLCRLF
jgi:hypothetical protein